MSTEDDKIKNSTRRHKDTNAINKQVKIAKSNNHFDQQNIKEPHRLVKHHAMDCGQAHCTLCGNPRHNRARKGKDRLTTQERRNNQKGNDE